MKKGVSLMNVTLSVRISPHHNKLCSYVEFYGSFNDIHMIYGEVLNSELDILETEHYIFKDIYSHNNNSAKVVKGFWVDTETKNRFNDVYNKIKTMYKHQKSVYISKGFLVEYILESFSAKHLDNYEKIKKQLKL
jgi:hypothetical protein